MIQPPMDVLKDKVDSRYTLVVMAARRARQLLEGHKSLVEIDSEKPVSIALEEIAQDKVTYDRPAGLDK